MRSLRSRFSGSVADVLSVACYAGLFAPWFVLAGAFTDRAEPVRLFWRLVVLLFLARALAGASRLYLERETRLRKAVAVALGIFGIILSWAVVAVPASRTEGAGTVGVSGAAWILPVWFVAGLLAWVKGTNFGARPPDNTYMHRQLAFGSVSIALCFVFAARLDVYDRVFPASLPFILFWSIGAIVATALMRLAELSRKGGSESGEVTRFWPYLLILTAAGCLAFAILFSVISPVVLHLLQVPARLLLRVAGFCLAIIAFFLGMIVQGIAWLWELIMARRTGKAPEMPKMAGFEKFSEEQVLRPLPVAVGEAAKWLVIVAAALAAVALVVYYLLRVWAKDRELSPDESRESFASIDALAAWAASRWREVLEAAGRGAGRFIAARARHARPRTATEIYHAVLDVAAGKGQPRPVPVTPYRFQPVLVACFPGTATALDEILLAFSAEYYGERCLSEVTLQGLYQEWLTVQREAE